MSGSHAQSPLSTKRPYTSPTSSANMSCLSYSSHLTKQIRRHGPVVYWFRKDLRLNDNKGLYKAWVQAAEVNRVNNNPSSSSPNKSHYSPSSEDSLNGALLGIFVVCGHQWYKHDLSPAKVDLMLRSIRDLQIRLETTLNIPLTILHAQSIHHVPRVVHEYCVNNNATHLFYNIEYELDEMARDDHTISLLQSSNITVIPSHDECIVPPGLVKTKDGSRLPIVFTPFRKAWELLVRSKQPYDYLALSPMPEPNPSSVKTIIPHLFNSPVPELSLTEPLSVTLPGFQRTYCSSVFQYTRQHFPEGEDAAHNRLTQFVNNKIKGYSVDRDFPHLDGTSNLSAYLALGMISSRQCVYTARNVNNGQLDSGDKGCVHWIQEIIWREFYRHILVEYPRVCKRQPFKLNTMNVPWSEGTEADEHFKAWCEGRTGYPIVDAGMRQLLNTGIMSNRLRMITAMFLTKDLLIDWRRGEKFFMQHLIDGDFASNNGGWQWAASTGTDSQPYFRIFNPYLQSAKFDPKGEYIRKYVPDLQSVKTAAIHEPNVKLSTSEFMRLGYPAPIVDHKEARNRVLAAFKVPVEQAH